MRLIAMLAAAAALAACQAPRATQDTMSRAKNDAAPCATRMMCMEDAWARSKRELAAARSDAHAEGREMPPVVEAEVDEVLNREVGSDTDDARLEQLRDAVSDARRLAAIVSAG